MPLDQDFTTKTVNPTNLWTDSNTSYNNLGNLETTQAYANPASPRTTSSTPPIGPSGQSSISSAASTEYKPLSSVSPFTAPQPENKRSNRARHAANERHKQPKNTRKDSHQTESTDAPETPERKASGKQLKLREKNKVAAAKCRSRQRKQVQNIEAKCNHLSAANGELKRQVRDLSGELSDLRSLALNHQTCNCRIAMYNYYQAQKVVAGLQASSMEKNMSEMKEEPG